MSAFRSEKILLQRSMLACLIKRCKIRNDPAPKRRSMLSICRRRGQSLFQTLQNHRAGKPSLDINRHVTPCRTQYMMNNIRKEPIEQEKITAPSKHYDSASFTRVYFSHTFSSKFQGSKTRTGCLFGSNTKRMEFSSRSSLNDG